KEYADLLAELGLDADKVRAFFDAHPSFASGLHRSPHAAAGSAADRLAEFAPFIGKSETQIRILQAKVLAKKTLAAARALPGALAKLRKRAIERSPVLFEQAREEWIDAKPLLVQKAKDAVRARAEAFGFVTPKPAPAAPSERAAAA